MKNIKKYCTIVLILGSWLLALTITSCSDKPANFIGSGNFEAVEVLVSAQANGQIFAFDIVEGDLIKQDEVLCYVDTAQLHLKKMQLLSALRSAKSRQPEKGKQIAALEESITIAQRERIRIENLVADKTVSQKNLDDIDNQIVVLNKQLAAAKETLTMTIDGVKYESQAIEYQIDEVQLGIDKSYVRSPIDGIVLGKYAQAGELTGAGRPLLKAANVSELILRTYIQNTQLSTVKLNDTLKVRVEIGGKPIDYEGRVIWISDKAEFTPKGILTKNERDNLVYAVKIRVKNDGLLKIGMYGEVYR
ncbi:MAG: HlyD family efflux transporter periplasmic adaptor subunit [Bacteroidales bacterium]|jgi:HlyD family secretion protein|nr:HlyD family efflux transporter periplasmic adaptor subunit [Bacteroidales bacterium]